MIVQSKTGRPCVWEEGGGRTNTGFSRIVADPWGQPLKPIYVKKGGVLACSQHALMPVGPGCWVVEAAHRSGEFDISIFEVTGTPSCLESRRRHRFSQGEWDKTPPEWLEEAVKAAQRKSQTYHCRYAVFTS